MKVKMEKTDIPTNIKHSISSSYIAFGKKHGFNPKKWGEYFERKAKSGRRLKTMEWMRGNKEATIDYILAITEKHKRRYSEWDSYQDYLDSDIWKEARKKYLKGKRCLICGLEKKLVLHHLRYRDSNGDSILGEETEEDLAVLCWNCHTSLHKRYGKGASFGMKEIRGAKIDYYLLGENEKDMEFIILLKGGDSLIIDTDAKNIIEGDMVNEKKVSSFGDAIIVLSEVRLILRMDTANSRNYIPRKEEK